MKKTFYLCLLLLCVSCATNTEKGIVQNETSNGLTTTVFEEYGFSITTPCVLEDALSGVRDLVQGSNIDACHVGIENPDDSVNTAAYQVTVIKLPTSLKDEQKTEFIKNIENVRLAGFTNVEKVEFSDNKYPGFVGDIDKNGCKNRVVLFIKDKQVIELMVSTNTGLDEKFKSFTDSFKVID